MLLAFDTASAAVTVAVSDGTAIRSRRPVPTSAAPSQRHAEALAPLIAAALAEAGAGPGDLTAVVVGVGPGPYTGLRVGLVTARMLGFTLGIPVHGVCSLDVVAHAAVRAGVPGEEFLVATDARRREVYWAAYAADRSGAAAVPWRRLAGPDVAAPAAIPRAGRSVAGRGALLYRDVLGEPMSPLDPDAADLADLAAVLLATGVPLLPPDPLYLRRPDAQRPGAPKRVLR